MYRNYTKNSNERSVIISGNSKIVFEGNVAKLVNDIALFVLFLRIAVEIDKAFA